MLQTIGQVLLAIVIAVLGFAVVVAVCIVILRLLMVVLPGRDEAGGEAAGDTSDQIPERAEEQHTGS
jgi:hypothetical protein